LRGTLVSSLPVPQMASDIPVPIIYPTPAVSNALGSEAAHMFGSWVQIGSIGLKYHIKGWFKSQNKLSEAAG
jgi:hypothetical protein